ncbi:MAG: YlbF family regulator [Clostridia bacterium]|nr:YlbF family regulator [Clostridia bacterium]
MTVIEITRQLGVAIQEDPRYKEYEAARQANEKDDALNELIGGINLIQLNYQNEAAKGEEADAAKMEQFAKEFEEKYREIMLNGNMIKFETAKNTVDAMMNEIMGILACCVDGQDPATCSPEQEHHCSGSCDSCGGCH